MMKEESFKCTLISWEEAVDLSCILSSNIKSSGFDPDLIVAIGRGGYVPARIVCDRLMMHMLTSIKIEHWGEAAHRWDTAKVRFPLPINVEGQKLLVVDDVTDTGDTLRAAVEHISTLKPKEIRTAVLQHKTTSTFQPDYHAQLVTLWRWIIYPWAAHEDLVGFVERVLFDGPMTYEEIAHAMKTRFDLSPNETAFDDALKDIVELGRAKRESDVYVTTKTQKC